ncbi:unnamed protein product [Arctia plantaginis]|uniref:Major facilitator superfamily (MFS) profile domain-containing protein n=1 Tax=Arctia plantaginis TaxID=874455 RepID=A0A8S0YUX9_ARCPL|nr:unnamed protein product [Arctia plantaginis]
MSRNPENPETPHESEKASQPKPSGNEESTQPQSPVKTSPLGDYSLEELEEGLSIIGLGRYNLKYAMFIALLLVSSMIEVVGNSVVLPAAQCDLGISDGMQASGPESPKFLLSRGKPEEALKVLRTMYAHNHNKAPEDFPIKSLHAPPLTEPVNMVECLKRQTTPLLEEQYLKYILLNGFLLFGVFVILNGVYVWILEALNRVLSYDDNDQTACQIIMESVENDDQDNTCDDMIDTTSIMMNSIAQVVCAIIGIGISFTIKCIGKSYVLFYCFFIIGTCCLIVNFISDSTLFLILTSLFPLITLAIGPINLYCMEIYPVHMRGMAVLLCMMLGRMGSIIGSTMTGIMINRACHAMFYLCAILLYVCASLSLFLPGAQMMQNIKNLSKRQ